MGDHLNTSQTEAAEYDGDIQYLLVNAGAGTGKTHTMISRIQVLIERGTDPKKICAITFTRRAAREMKKRLISRLDETGKQVLATTFHGFCLGLIFRSPKAFGIQKSTVIDRDDQLSLMRMARGHLLPTGIKQFPKAESLASWLSFAKNTGKPLRSYFHEHTDTGPAEQALIIKMLQAYEMSKRQSNYLDYDDLLSVFVHGLETNARLRDRVQNAYEHILVDELQDTNPLQFRLLTLLCAKSKGWFVGDARQAIYAFRASDYRNCLNFTDRLENSATVELAENFRSKQPILNLANWLLSQSCLNYGLGLVAARGDSEELPLLLDFADSWSEASWIAEDIVQSHDDGVAWKDHMVMVRSGFAAREVEGALIEMKVPYAFIGGTSMLQAAHIKDVLALARASLDHTDQIAWIRYLKMFPGIGEATARKIVDCVLSAGTYELAMKKAESATQNRNDILNGLRSVREEGGGPAFQIQASLDYLSKYLSKHYERWETRLKDIEMLIVMARKHPSLEAFLNTYALDPVSSTEAKGESDPDIVTLITCHSAKGTEAPVCYIPKLEPGMFPHSRSIGNLDAEEEERRILYVAITRARDRLTLSRSICFDPGPYLLAQVPAHLVDTQSMHSDEAPGGLYADLFA